MLETLLPFILAAIFALILARYTPYCPNWWSSEIITPEHIRISGVSRLNKEIPLGPGLEYELYSAENKKDFCIIFFHYGCGRKYAGLHFLTKYESEMIVAYINAAQAASTQTNARDAG